MKLPPVDAVVALEIGNTRLGMAVSDADGMHDVRRVYLNRHQDWEASLADVWAAGGPARKRVVIGSVCPPQNELVESLAERVCGQAALQLRRDVPLPMPLDVERPDEVGVDRVCSAAAAYERIGAACAVASFGTAITIDCVSETGQFMGGAILPGLQMSLDALHARTAQLPQVEATAPTGPFGKNTQAAITNGVAYGAVGALREIVERFATELGRWPQLVLTGGNATLIASLADFVDAVVPDLCLMGIALAYRRAAGQP